MAGLTALSRGGESRATREVDAVVLLSVYLVVLYGIPSHLVIGPLGSAGAVSMLLGLGGFAFWLLGRTGAVRRTELRPQPMRIAVVLFMICTGISYALAMSRPISSDEISPADVALLSLLSWSGPLLIAHDGVSSRQRLSTLVWRITIAGGLMAALGLVQFFTQQAIVDRIRIPGLTQVAALNAYVRGGRIRPSGTAIHPLEYGAILTILLPIALHVAFHHRSRPVVLRWMPALAIGAVVAISSSRSAYMTAAVAVLVSAIGWSRKQRLVVLTLGVAGVLALMAAAPHLVNSVLNLFTGAEQDPSIASRTDSFSVAGSFLALHPLFGRGLGTFLPKYRIFDDQYLGLLVSVGVAGTLAFLGILGTALTLLIRAFRAARRDAEDRDLAVSLVGALVSGFLSLAFFDAFAFPMTMGTVFLCLGLTGPVSRLAAVPAEGRSALEPRPRRAVARAGVQQGSFSPSVQPRRARSLPHPAHAEQVTEGHSARRFAQESTAGLTDDRGKPEQQGRHFAVPSAEQSDAVDDEQ